MNDASLGGLIHGGNILARNGASLGSIASGDGGAGVLRQGLQARVDGFILHRAPGGFTDVFLG